LNLYLYFLAFLVGLPPVFAVLSEVASSEFECDLDPVCNYGWFLPPSGGTATDGIDDEEQECVKVNSTVLGGARAPRTVQMGSSLTRANLNGHCREA